MVAADKTATSEAADDWTMLTLFTIPRSFDGPNGVAQRNALASWARLGAAVEVLMFGNDPGVAEAAHDYRVLHEPTISLTEHGTPLISEAFSRTAARSTRPYLMYSNADMLYDDGVLTALRLVSGVPDFLLSGRRHDLDVDMDLTTISNSAWRDFFGRHCQVDRLHGYAGMDYFIFPRALSFDMPTMAVGRLGWDSWLVWNCRMRGIPVIDATFTVRALHQNHGYADVRLGHQHRYGPERDVNIKAGGGLSRMLTLREANFVLRNGSVVPPPPVRRLSAVLATTSMYQKLLALRRTIRRDI